MAREASAWLACACAAALLGGGCRSVERFLAPRVADVQIPLHLDQPSELMAPENLRVRSSAERSIVLSWSPVLVGDVAGYAIQRSLDAAGPFELVGRTQSRFGTIYTDSGEREGVLGDGQTYHYRVQPYDALGRVSRTFAHVTATTDAAPETPRGLIVYSSLPRKVVLSWDPAPDAVAAYAVYRSPTAAGPYERVAQIEGRLNTVYEDAVAGDLRVMYYRISALNRFAGESQPTAPQRAVTKAEPLPPLGLRVEARELGALTLAWTPNVETDLRVYEIWRSENGPEGWTAGRAIAEIEPPAEDEGQTHESLTWVDRSIGCGQAVRYRMRARDRDGLHSDFSAELETVGDDLDLAIVAGELRWNPERAAGWQRARIELERGMGLPARVLGHAEGSPHFALPADVDPGAVLRVVLERPGRESPACAVSAGPGAATSRS